MLLAIIFEYGLESFSLFMDKFNPYAHNAWALMNVMFMVRKYYSGICNFCGNSKTFEQNSDLTEKIYILFFKTVKIC